MICNVFDIFSIGNGKFHYHTCIFLKSCPISPQPSSSVVNWGCGHLRERQTSSEKLQYSCGWVRMRVKCTECVFHPYVLFHRSWPEPSQWVGRHDPWRRCRDGHSRGCCGMFRFEELTDQTRSSTHTHTSYRCHARAPAMIDDCNCAWLTHLLFLAWMNYAFITLINTLTLVNLCNRVAECEGLFLDQLFPLT